MTLTDDFFLFLIGLVMGIGVNTLVHAIAHHLTRPDHKGPQK